MRENIRYTLWNTNFGQGERQQQTGTSLVHCPIARIIYILFRQRTAELNAVINIKNRCLLANFYRSHA